MECFCISYSPSIRRREDTINQYILMNSTIDISRNVEQVLATSLCDTKLDAHRQDAELSSNFARSVIPSDCYVTNSQTQLRASHNEGDENAEIQTYILSVGTVKRDVLSVPKSIQSQALHKSLLDTNIKVIDGVDYLSTLVDYHVAHELLLHDGISQTQQWGTIHHFYVKVIGSQSVAYGTAALLGEMLKQDAIGIYHPLTEDDHLILRTKQGQPLPDNVHQYFTVYSTTPISRSTTLNIIENVCKRFQELSGQLDTSGQSSEFHDFDLSFKGTSAQIEEFLKENFQQMFQVETHFAKSTLLTRNDYKQAFAASCLEINR